MISLNDANLAAKNISKRIVEELEEKVVSIYLFGSLALGDFSPEFSDLDLAIILKEDLDGKSFDLIKKLQLEFSEKYPHWNKDGIEMIFVSIFILQNFKKQKTLISVTSPGMPLQTIENKEYYQIYWYFLQDYGKLLYGKDINEIIPKIQKHEFIEQSCKFMLNELPIWEDLAKQSCHDQYYLVVTICRILYLIENKSHTSKKKALFWAIDFYPEFKDLFEFCWSWRGKWQIKGKPLDSINLVLKFFNFAELQVRKYLDKHK